MNQYNIKKGFTIIELMLAMAFVAALLLAIAMTVIQIGNIYNRGLTYKDVNQVGGSLSNELQRSINGSTPFDLSKMYIDKSWGGRLCTGKYSYIWNYGADISTNSSNLYKYVDSDVDVIRFVKVIDTGGTYCTDPISRIIRADAVELIDASQNNLALHNFYIGSTSPIPIIDDTAFDSKAGQRMYNISFLLGTNEQAALTGSYVSTACSTEDDNNSNVSYCAVNQFNIVARAGNTAE